MTKQYLTNTNHILVQHGRKLKTEVRENLFYNRSKVLRLQEHSITSSKYRLRQEQETIERVKRNIPILYKQTLNKTAIELSQLEHSIKLMDPLNVLKRG